MPMLKTWSPDPLLPSSLSLSLGNLIHTHGDADDSQVYTSSPGYHNQGRLGPPKDIQQCLETFVVVTIREGCY